MARSQTPRATRAQVARDHADLARRRGVRALVATALRSRSVHAREILAEFAWPGSALSEVINWAESPTTSVPPEVSAEAIGWLGHVIALQNQLPSDLAHGRALLETAIRHTHVDTTPPELVETLAQLLLLQGDRPAVLSLLENVDLETPVIDAVRVDLLNPFLSPGGRSEEWTSAFSHFLTEGEAQQVQVSEAAPTSRQIYPFDRLTTPALPTIASALKVTVAISCFRPGPELRTAVLSAVRQTWRNLEILVIDDASGPGYDAVLAEIATVDPRVKVIRKAVNGGTYRARNTALRVATGDFFTVLDSDDWLHPQAIEKSIEPLLQSAEVIATRHAAVRVSNDLRLTRLGYEQRHQSAHSLMFRTSEALGRIGFFDPSRKGADTEYARRLVAAFGRPTQDINTVLTVTRLSEGLSSSEFGPGWRHGSRHAYKCMYRPWHDAIKNSEADPFLDPWSLRPFPTSRRWTRENAFLARHSKHFDVCFAGDWRRYGGPQKSMLSEIDAARGAGLKVAVMHLEAMRFMTRRDEPLCAEIVQRIRRNEVELLHADDDANISLLLVRYPPILQYPPHIGTSVRVQETVVVANQAPVEPDGSDQRYVVSDVTQRAAETFGSPVSWLPQSPRIRSLLKAQDPDVPMLDWDNPGLIDTRDWTRTRPAPTHEHEVVIGRYSRDHPMKFPVTFSDLRRSYDFPENYRVRVMGGTKTVPQLAAAEAASPSDVPLNWEVLPHGAVDVHDFLESLDFFVYYDNPTRHEAFGRVLLEAAASGTVTIADPRHRETFGDAIDYAPPGEAPALVAHYVAEPDLYERRSAQMRRIVAERFGYEGFTDRLMHLLQRSRPSPVRSTATDRHPATTLDLRIHDNGTTRPISVHPRGEQHVISLPVRTLADASQMDEVVLVVEGSDDEVAKWVQRELVVDVEDLRFSDDSLMRAPAALVCIAQRRGRAVRLLARAELSPRVTTGLRQQASPAEAWTAWQLCQQEAAFRCFDATVADRH